MSELRDRAIASGMKTIKESAFEMVKNGITTLSEMIEISHGI